MPRPWEERIKRPGLFIKEELGRRGRASVAELHQAYSERIATENDSRKQQGRRDTLRKPTYHSFYDYFRVLVKLGLVERAGESEVVRMPNPAAMAFTERADGDWDFIEGARMRYWALTREGRVADTAWQNPWNSLYPR